MGLANFSFDILQYLARNHIDASVKWAAKNIIVAIGCLHKKTDHKEENNELVVVIVMENFSIF